MMKKTVSIILLLTMLLSSLLVCGNVYAEEEAAESEENKITVAELNTLYEAAFEKTDEVFDKKAKQYYDTFEFSVPYEGKITFTVKSEMKGYISKYARYIIMSKKSDKFWSPDSSKFKGKWSITLKKGDYYLVAIYTKTKDKNGEMLGGSYNFKLAYKPNLKTTEFTKVKAKKAGFNAEWKKAKAVTGYQLEYSVKKSFAKSEKIKIKGAKTVLP